MGRARARGGSFLRHGDDRRGRRVYREMLRWNAQWRLSVDIANVTAAFSAINIAGPDSRAVLEALGCSIDVSADAFPYLGCREGDVAGIPRA